MAIQPRPRSLQVAETPRIRRMPGRIGSEAAERRIVHRLVDGVRDTFGHHAVLAGVDGLMVAGVEILQLLRPNGLVALKGRVE